MAVDKNKLEEEARILRFYKIVLSWDYARLLKESQKRKGDKNAGDGGTSPCLKEVKSTYKDVEDYMSTFEPLLFEEAKAQIIQGKDEEEATEWMKGATAECSEVNGFWLPMVLCQEAGSISQHDLLLLSSKQFGAGKDFPTAYAFALVEAVEHCQLDGMTHRMTHGMTHMMRLRMNLSGEIQGLNTDDVRSCPRLIKMHSLVTQVPKSVFIMKISSLSTIVREYVALRSVSTLPFRDLILTAAENNDASEDHAWKISKPLKEFIESNHNISQIEAINAGLSRRKFVLIQGPPGTGKTQTILGLLSAILHATPARMHADRGKLAEMKHGPELTYSHWAKASPWLTSINPRDGLMPLDGDDGFFPKTGNELKPEQVNANRKYRVRVLVCAPSNSALDEIVLRLLNTGIRDENDHAYSPKIVRIGIKPHHSVRAVSMDHLVEQKLVGMDTQSAGDKQKQGGGAKDRDSIRASIVDEAVIVFSTLSFSGSSVFSTLNRGFDVVIIDEAAQAVEPATLVPLANGCKQVFLVGDPVQLPATVISPVAEKFGYGMSLFKRFQKAGYPVQMLKTQYRMHPEIRSFPSKEFYDEALEDGPDVLIQTKRSWHEYRCFGPFSFFDVHDGKESQPSGSGSWVNHDEVEFILAMYNKLVTRYPELKSSARLAIISPYRQQVKLFRDKFQETFGMESEKLVDINTVDGFQGREKDVAIFSCVRASKDKGMGFVADFRRMNVGITRARSSVLVVGSASTLKRDQHWKNLVQSAESRDALIKVSKPYAEFFGDSNLKTYEMKESMLDRVEAPPESTEVDVSAVDITAGVPEPGAAEQDWGDGGDGEGFDGGYDDD